MQRSLLLIVAAVAVSAQPNLPGMAVGMLDQAKLARDAVASHDRGGALDHINQSLSLANEIEQNSANAPKPLLIPVYTQIETTTYTPVKHKHGEMSADRMTKNTSIRGVESETATSKLNVLAAANHLRGAQNSLASDDWKGADTALAEVANSVVVTQSQDNMPLEMARQNLQLARTRVIDGKYDDAVMPLRSASQALAEFEKHCTGQTAHDVDFARQAISEYADNVPRNPDGAAARIDRWLDSLRLWSTNSSQ